MIQKKYLSVLAGFIVMLCLGGVYAWSIFAVELKVNYGFSSLQTQIIFGSLIAILTVSMIFGNKILKRYGAIVLGSLSGILFLAGYILAYLSKGNFLLLYSGMGVITGVATGFGYLTSLTVPVTWFPEKRGLVTGIITAGFGAGAIVVSFFASALLRVFEVSVVFAIIGIGYGFVIIVASQFFTPAPKQENTGTFRVAAFLKQQKFALLFIGIFSGTFAGLLIIGNLKHIGLQYNLPEFFLIKGIVLFSAANLTGRVFWGWLADYISAAKLMPVSIVLIGIFSFLIGYAPHTPLTFLALSFGVGFSFGANFVLYAKEAANVYGINNLSGIYPYIFLGYGLSGIIGPPLGGLLFDLSGNYHTASFIAFGLCSVVAAWHFIKNRENVFNKI